MRTQGIGDLSDVRYAILEQNGKISFIKGSESPNIATALVIDTNPKLNNIKEAGLDMEWLTDRLNERDTKLCEVFLMTVNEDGKITLIKKEK